MSTSEHISATEIRAYVRSQVANEDIDRIHDHLRGCEQCRGVQAKALDEFLGTPPAGTKRKAKPDGGPEPAPMANRGYASRKTTMKVLANVRNSCGDVEHLAPLGVDVGYHVEHREMYVRLWFLDAYHSIDWTRGKLEAAVWFFGERVTRQNFDEWSAGAGEVPKKWEWKPPQAIFKASLPDGWHVENEIGACRPRVDFHMKP